MELKDLIREKRLAKGMTLQQLADKIGSSIATVSRWEAGLRWPQNYQLEQVIVVLEIDPHNIERRPAPSYWSEMKQYMVERPEIADKIRRIIELIHKGDINDRGFHRKLDEVLDFKYNKARRQRYASMRYMNPNKRKGLKAWNLEGRPTQKALPEADIAAGVTALEPAA